MTRRIHPLRRTVVFAFLGLVVAACSGAATEITDAGGTTSTTAAEPTTTTEDATTTSAATATTEAADTTVASQLPDSPVTAGLGEGTDNTYKLAIPAFTPVDFDESELPVPPGSAEVRWYTSGDRYVVAYVGVDLAETGPLCPGNSILTLAGSFENVSNAPTEEGACEGFTTLTSDPEVGPRDCNGSLLYVTAIPSDQQGILYGSVEALADDGAAIIGLTSQAETSADIPEIDVDAVCG